MPYFRINHHESQTRVIFPYAPGPLCLKNAAVEALHCDGARIRGGRCEQFRFHNHIHGLGIGPMHCLVQVLEWMGDYLWVRAR